MPNKQAVEWAVLAALALNCDVLEFSKFDRKNYFYPDLPKGYQISQFDQPIGVNGYLDIGPISPIGHTGHISPIKRIRVTRVHLEEDAAKLIHSADKKHSFVDYNRSGTPLLEIVTEPDIKSPQEAKIFLQELRLIMRYLGISSADMEKGHLRCDANISLLPPSSLSSPSVPSSSPLDSADAQSAADDADNLSAQSAGVSHLRNLNPKTEIKNLNSFKAVERALEYEIMRQTKLFKEGKPPHIQSTRGWNDAAGVTEEQRTKEESHDYRYFPEPDIPPLNLAEIKEKMKLQIPELPAAKRIRFQDEYGFSPSDAKILISDINVANYAEKVFSELAGWLNSSPEIEGTETEILEKYKEKMSRLISTWLITKLFGLMEKNKIDIQILKITPENFAEFLKLIYQNELGGQAAMTVLEEMLVSGGDPSQIMDEKRLGKMDDEEKLAGIIQNIIKNNPKQVADYKAGKVELLQFFIGVTLKETDGRADAKVVQRLLSKLLRT